AAAAVRVGGVSADGPVQRTAQLFGTVGVDVRVVAVVVVIATASASAGGHVEADAGVRGRVRAAGIGDRRGIDRKHAVLATVQRGAGGQGEAGAGRSVRQRHAARCVAGQGERAAGRVHHFAEGHLQVAGGREVGGAVGRRGG